MKLPLSVAVSDYDRTRALFDGRVKIEGCESNVFSPSVEEIFFRAIHSEEFDVAELSLSSYTMQCSRDASSYIAIPVFLSRMFRHSAIYVRKDSGIARPADLMGKLIGLPEYQLTALVWVRGMLEDDYGVKPSSIAWRCGGVEQPGRREKVDFTAPKDVEILPIPSDQTLNTCLIEGKIDALISPRAPSAFFQNSPAIIRLFEDFRTVEKAYYERNSIFPIMHLVGIRKSLVKQYPWLAASVYKAFCEAKSIAINELAEVGTLKTSLPWLAAEYEETKRIMGEDFWPYGIASNEKTLKTFLRYHHSQGLSARPLSLSDMFASSTMEHVRI